MSLFFYGAMGLSDNREEVVDYILNLGKELDWHVDFDTILQENSAAELFGNSMESEDLLAFELRVEDDGVHEKLYDDYGGEIMAQRYREIARQLGKSEWAKMEFGASKEVDEVYRRDPPELPVIRFVGSLVDRFARHKVVVCLDEGFENRFDCREVTGDKEIVLREIWSTIAFGYSWPNLRINHKG